MNRFLGLLLMAIGRLIATLCGICSIGALGSFLVESIPSLHHSSISVIISSILFCVTIVLMVGGLPLLLGLGLFFGGLRVASDTSHSEVGAVAYDSASDVSLKPRDPWGVLADLAPGALVLILGIAISAYFSVYASGYASLEKFITIVHTPPEMYGKTHPIAPPPPPASGLSRVVGGGLTVFGILMVVQGISMMKRPRSAVSRYGAPGFRRAKRPVGSEEAVDPPVGEEDP